MPTLGWVCHADPKELHALNAVLKTAENAGTEDERDNEYICLGR